MTPKQNPLSKNQNQTKGKNTNLGGRPVSLDNPKTRADFMSAIAYDMSIEASCAYAKITKQTYYNYIKKHPEFLDEIEEKRQLPYQKAVITICKAIEEDPAMALKYLERKHKNEFSPRTEITGANGKNLFANMTDEELEEYIKDES